MLVTIPYMKRLSTLLMDDMWKARNSSIPKLVTFAHLNHFEGIAWHVDETY